MNSLQLILKDIRYFAPVWTFASLNILLGTWVLYIPNIKENLALNDAELGIALFCYAMGILVMIPFISSINRKVGVGKYTIIGVVLFSLVFILPFWTTTYIELCISLFIVGIFSGSTDISMNALVSEVERTNKVNFMSAAHGFFSLGGVIGAGIGSFILVGLVSPKAHITIVATFILLTNLFLSRNYIKIKESEHESSETKTSIVGYSPLIIVAFIAFAIMGSEGAIENWSKLYLIDVVNVTSEKVAGYGFVFFSTTMALGRFFGDGISLKFGSENTIIGGSILAIVSYLGIVSGGLYSVLGGFGLLGLGLSVIIPELFRIAGQTEGVSPSGGIAFVSGVGFLGFLIGPVAMGFISNQMGLKMSFIALLGVIIIATFLAILRKVMK